MKTSVILLAGGIGARMNSNIPKQYLLLKDKPIALYSYDLFKSMPDFEELIVVCSTEYQYLFPEATSFALPGDLRQDSVYNGLMKISDQAKFVCIHDSSRPIIDATLVRRVLESAWEHGAAAAGMPLKFTLKQCDQHGFVQCTPERSTLWEVQTPQVVRIDWLKEGYTHAMNNKITVTDDLSLVELINYPTKMVEGSYQNIKITTAEDMSFAEQFIR